MDYFKKYKLYKNKYLILKNQLGSAHKCPIYGFTQHSGECWHDSFSTIICFADTLNDRIQSVLSSDFNLDEFIDSVKNHKFLLPINYDFEEIDDFMVQSKIYLKNFIQRLSNKLDENKLSLEEFVAKKPSEKEIETILKSEQNINIHGETSNYKFPTRITRSNSFINTTTCAINTYKRHDRNIIKGQEAILYNGHGGDVLHGLLNLQLINYYFYQDNTFINVNRFNKNNISELTDEFIDRVTGIALFMIREGKGHQIAFYQCDGKLFYYDDSGLRSGNVITDRYNWKLKLKEKSKDVDFFSKIDNDLGFQTSKIFEIECYYIDTYECEEDYYIKIFKNYNYFNKYNNSRLSILKTNEHIPKIKD